MIGRLIEAERLCEMEMNMEEKKCYKTLKTTISVQIVIDQEQGKNLGPLNYLRRLVTNDEKYKREIKSRVAMAKAAFNKRNGFNNKLGFN